MTMDESTMRAFEWASNQNHQSVAARYARTLAEYVKSVGHIELDYPNWQGKFPTIAEAVKRHTANQDAVIANLRRNIKDGSIYIAMEANINGKQLVIDSLIQRLELAEQQIACWVVLQKNSEYIEFTPAEKWRKKG